MKHRHAAKLEIKKRLDRETGTIQKSAAIRVAMVYPSPYRVGMSSLGFQTIYRILNGREDVVAQRAFLPDDVDTYRKHRIPLMCYESLQPVGESDIFAVSLSYETEVLGLIACLELAGMPLRAIDRDQGWPLVLLGGPITFSNPLPVAPFCDIVVMGEADEVLDRILDLWSDSNDKESFLERAGVLPGIYVPSLHGEKLVQVGQSADSRLPAFSQIITPDTELSNMHLVENARGCHRGCTFCVMRRTTNGGMRTVSVERVLETIPPYAKRVGLVGAATTDHPQILDILRGIVETGREVGLSSLRADRLNDEFVGLLAQGGVRTLTVASDGASERLRKIARKGIRAEHLLQAAAFVRDKGLKTLKVYVVIGYPEEEDHDIEEMISLFEELAAICPVALGISPLVAKKNTPLDGVDFQDERMLRKRIQKIRRRLGKRVDIRSTSVRWAWVEYQIAQGGWDMAAVAEDVYKNGGNHAAWRTAIEKLEPTTAPVVRPASDRIKTGALLNPAIRKRDREAPVDRREGAG